MINGGEEVESGRGEIVGAVSQGEAAENQGIIPESEVDGLLIIGCALFGISEEQGDISEGFLEVGGEAVLGVEGFQPVFGFHKGLGVNPFEGLEVACHFRGLMDQVTNAQGVMDAVIIRDKFRESLQELEGAGAEDVALEINLGEAGHHLDIIRMFGQGCLQGS